MRTVVDIADAVRRGEKKAAEVLDESLADVESSNSALNALVHADPAMAHEAAVRVDAAVARGEDPGPLAGVPFGVKDLEDCAGMPTSHGSLLFKGRGPVPADSIHVARLRAAGAAGRRGCPPAPCPSPPPATAAARPASRRRSPGWWASSRATAASPTLAPRPRRRPSSARSPPPWP